MANTLAYLARKVETAKKVFNSFVLNCFSLSIYLSVYLSIYLSISISVCLGLSLYIFQYLFPFHFIALGFCHPPLSFSLFLSLSNTIISSLKDTYRSISSMIIHRLLSPFPPFSLQL